MAIPWHIKFPGQRLNLSHSCNLHHNCSNARSFNPLCRARDPTFASTVTRAAAVRFITHWAMEGTLLASPFDCLLATCQMLLLCTLLNLPMSVLVHFAHMEAEASRAWSCHSAYWPADLTVIQWPLLSFPSLHWRHRAGWDRDTERLETLRREGNLIEDAGKLHNMLYPAPGGGIQLMQGWENKRVISRRHSTGKKKFCWKSSKAELSLKGSGWGQHLENWIGAGCLGLGRGWRCYLCIRRKY